MTGVQTCALPIYIVVLVPSVGHADYYQAIKHHPLPTGIAWAIEEYCVEGGIRVETVHRFKGLEAAVVYLWGADTLSPQTDVETLYVTLSRAKSRLVLVGDGNRCGSLLSAKT